MLPGSKSLLSLRPRIERPQLKISKVKRLKVGRLADAVQSTSEDEIPLNTVLGQDVISRC